MFTSPQNSLIFGEMLQPLQETQGRDINEEFLGMWSDFAVFFLDTALFLACLTFKGHVWGTTGGTLV